MLADLTLELIRGQRLGCCGWCRELAAEQCSTTLVTHVNEYGVCTGALSECNGCIYTRMNRCGDHHQTGRARPRITIPYFGMRRPAFTTRAYIGESIQGVSRLLRLNRFEVVMVFTEESCFGNVRASGTPCDTCIPSCALIASVYASSRSQVRGRNKVRSRRHNGALPRTVQRTIA